MPHISGFWWALALPTVSERTHYLFRKEEAQALTKRKKKDVKQLSIFDSAGSNEDEDNDWEEKTYLNWAIPH